MTDLSRPEGPYIYRLVSHIHSHIRLHISYPFAYPFALIELLCTDMSCSPEAYLHTPTAYQTDLSCEAHDAGTHAAGDVTGVHVPETCYRFDTRCCCRGRCLLYISFSFSFSLLCTIEYTHTVLPNFHLVTGDNALKSSDGWCCG